MGISVDARSWTTLAKRLPSTCLVVESLPTVLSPPADGRRRLVRTVLARDYGLALAGELP